MLDSILTFFFGSKRDRDVKQLLPIVEKINQKEDWAKSLKPEDFPLQTAEFKKRIPSCGVGRNRQYWWHFQNR